MPNREIILRKEIVRIGKLLYDKNLIIASDGNISTRLNKKIILITPSGLCKGRLKPHEIVRMTVEGEPIIQSNVKPSSEFQMHLALYKKRLDIHSIIHAHPLYTTTLASANYQIKQKVKEYFLKLSEVSQMVGQIAWVRKYQPGSKELAKATVQKITKSNIVILANHGIIVVGENLNQTLYRIERVEFASTIYYLSQLVQISCYTK